MVIRAASSWVGSYIDGTRRAEDTLGMSTDADASTERYGSHGKILVVDLSDSTFTEELVDEEVYRKFLGGYGLGAWLMWKHFPKGTEALAPEACFAICAGLLTGVKTPFSGRIQIVGKSPLTGTWADSNSGGSVASQLRCAGYDALLVRGAAEKPTTLVIRDGDVEFVSADDLWGK
jgi:aldehyde:ferredoxin oxidoreductase